MAPTNRHIWLEKRFRKQFSVRFKDLPCCQRNLDGKLISSNQNLSVCTLKEMRMFNKCTFHSGLFISCTYVCVCVCHPSLSVSILLSFFICPVRSCRGPSCPVRTRRGLACPVRRRRGPACRARMRRGPSCRVQRRTGVESLSCQMLIIISLNKVALHRT